MKTTFIVPSERPLKLNFVHHCAGFFPSPAQIPFTMFSNDNQSTKWVVLGVCAGVVAAVALSSATSANEMYTAPATRVSTVGARAVAPVYPRNAAQSLQAPLAAAPQAVEYDLTSASAVCNCKICAVPWCTPIFRAATPLA